ncbi:Putative fructokinase [Fundidesulfovibrio magnetotacticus]|uniref:fructokinase n=1 Tax=Fundidesulfovibrio magnetotacticus TaxID=2730080 RepID=A0A6V8LL04_9BACT|nr:ROK family protein [Fundidesulfovibrio magnetotacticus]GFK93373.1 Putative fructokinase [Fundidesulfovibrio magnetotacticus]
MNSEPNADAAPLLAGVETGGTKIVCAVARGGYAPLPPGDRFETLTGDDPRAAVARAAAWLHGREAAHGAAVAGLGVVSFGPVRLDPRAPDFGHVLATPKPGWSGFDLLGSLRAHFPGVPTGFETDVGGAALGEGAWGAARGLEDFVYVTMGTGIGGGAVCGGRVARGLTHPEMGHVRLPRLPGDDFPGVCPFHGDCWEGLCSGPAIRARTGLDAADLPADHPAWGLAAAYTGTALAGIALTLSPARIVLGGGVSLGGRLGREGFFAAVGRELLAALGGYVNSPLLTPQGVGDYLVPPGLGGDAGVAGALRLAREALEG